MNYLWRLLSGVALCLALVLGMAKPAWAGRPCGEPKPLKTETLQSALRLAAQTMQALEASRAQVVILARAGQDLGAYGLRWSHLGFAWRQREPDGSSTWRVTHKLNTCGTAEAALYVQGLGDFFLDDLWRFEAAWMEPTPEVQERLLAVLENPQLATRMHHKPYNMLSWPWSQKYQQSNQWALETLALALAAEPGDTNPEQAMAKMRAMNRLQAQSWLQARGYQPGVVQIGMFKRLGGRITRANIAFDDHPNDKRLAGHIETVTVDSVFSWLPRARLSEKPLVLLP